MSKFDRWIDTPIRRFKVTSTIFLAGTIVFLIGQFRVFSIMVTISNSRELLRLTEPNIRTLYWPIDLIATLMDIRIEVRSIIQTLINVLPIGFWIMALLLFYIASFEFLRRDPWYKHQQRIIVLGLALIIQSLVVNVLFLFGFSAGTVAIAIDRVQTAGMVGSVLAWVLGLASLIIGALLWIQTIEMSD